MDDPFENCALLPQQREVTLLFADMRGSTALAGTLATDPLASELFAHVLDCLSEAVVAHRGFIVDYYGDGLVAMWNAPTDQPDHASLACAAALRMIDSLPEVSDEWQNVIHSPLRLGIGVHTGQVQVGNAGSSKKVKYGPRGPNVNLTSRVESATKELHLPFVATKATADKLSDQFTVYRVCRAQLRGVEQPVDLYAVNPAHREDHVASAWRIYERALHRFEAGHFDLADEKLESLDDSLVEVPSRFLRERIQTELGRQRRRRSTDKPAAQPGGVVSLSST